MQNAQAFRGIHSKIEAKWKHYWKSRNCWWPWILSINQSINQSSSPPHIFFFFFFHTTFHIKKINVAHILHYKKASIKHKRQYLLRSISKQRIKYLQLKQIKLHVLDSDRTVKYMRLTLREKDVSPIPTRENFGPDRIESIFRRQIIYYNNDYFCLW